MTSPVSRGFYRLSPPEAADGAKLPPGQHVTGDFPVLSAGPPPHTPLPEWTFSIRQAGATLRPWTWPEFRALPASSRSFSSTPTGLGEGISFLFGMTDSAATA